MNIQTALLQGRKLLEDAGDSAPRLTSEVLLAHAIGCEKSWLYAHSDEELREVWWIHYGRYLHERLQGKPTQYITGRQEFYGRDFLVTPAVLIPRPETEHSVEAALALEHFRDWRRPLADARGSETSLRNREREQAAIHGRGDTAPNIANVLDIGTGSGAIGITLSLETRARVVCSDVSEAAARVAANNARRLGSAAEFVVCDLGSAFASGTFDLVVSNPPYIAATDRETLQPEVRDHEPHLALFAGTDGLDVYRRLIPEAARLLKPGGHLILEIGWLAETQVSAMLGEWSNVETKPDLAGIPRVVIAQRP